MKILMVAQEAAPYLRTGDLANVVAGLSVELRRQGHDVRLIIPRYRSLKTPGEPRIVIDRLDVPLGVYKRTARIWRLDGSVEAGHLPTYLVDEPFYFGRESPYGYLDDYERFIFFSRAVLELLQSPEFAGEDWQPEIIHGHDWIVGLMPLWLRHKYYQAAGAERPAFALTLHNATVPEEIGYRAISVAQLEDLGVYAELGETTSQVSFLVRGVLAADAVNTVSPTHASDIREARYAEKLAPALRARHDQLEGILNGLDYAVYNPGLDRGIAERFDRDALALRAENKSALQRECGFAVDPDRLLLGFVGRLIAEKGAGLLETVLPTLIDELGVQIVIAAIPGDYRYREFFTKAQDSYRGKLAVFFTTEEKQARQVFAGADVILVPSLHEPCGLQQMIAMRYGALPMVNRTGGLADSVAPWASQAIHGRGFVFATDENRQTPHEPLLDALRGALDLFQNKRRVWHDLQRHNMAVNFSWEKPTREYIELYERALAACRRDEGLPPATAIEEPDGKEAGDQRGPDGRLILNQSDLLIHTLLEIDELALTVDPSDYRQQVSRAVREYLRGDATLIWTTQEGAPQRLQIAGRSLKRDDQSSPPDFDPQAYSDEIELAPRGWQYLYRRDGEAITQPGYLGSELAHDQGWVTQLSAPLHTHGTMLGRIDVFWRDHNHPVSNLQLSAIRVFASAIAVNLEKLRIERQARQLLKIDQEMARAQSIDEIAQVVLSHARRLTGAQQARLDLVDVCSYTVSQNDAPVRGPAREMGSEASALRSGDTAHELWTRAGQLSVLRRPMPQRGGQALGLIEVSKAPPETFSPDEERALTYLAEQAADALQTTLIRQQHRDERVVRLNQLATSLIGQLEIEPFLKRMLETIATVLKIQAASLYLLHEKSDRLELRSSFGDHEIRLDSGASYAHGEGMLGHVLATGRTYRTRQDLLLGVPLKVFDPLSSHERVIGELWLERESGAGAVFTGEDQGLAAMIANVIAAVVYNTQSSEARLEKFSGDLRELSSVLAGGRDLDDLVHNVVETTAQVLDADAASLYLVDEARDLLVIKAATGYQKSLVKQGATYPRGVGLTGYIFKSGEVLNLKSVEELRGHTAWRGRYKPDTGNYDPKSFLGLPLKVIDRFTGDEKVIGVLKVEDIKRLPNHPEKYFTDQDQQLVTMMANVIATVVYNTQSSEARLEKLSGDLRELSKALAGGREMRELLDEVVNTTAQVLDADAASLYLVDEARDLLVIQAATGYQKSLVKQGATYKRGVGLTGFIFEKGELLNLKSEEDLRGHPYWGGRYRSATGSYDPKSFLGLPLKVIDRFTGNEKVIGVLKVEDIKHLPSHPEKHFTNQDEQLVTMMANIIATVVYNTQSSEARLEKLSGDLRELSKALAGGREMRDLVNQVVKTTAGVLNAEAASLYLVDEAKDQLVIQAATGYQEPLVKRGATYKRGEGLTGFIFQNGKLLNLKSEEELRGHEAWGGRYRSATGDYDPKSFLGLPLKVIDHSAGSEKVVGVLKVEDIKRSPNHPEEYFTNQDEQLVVMMANVIATVIYNTRQGKAEIGAIIQQLGTLAAPNEAARQLLGEFARSEDDEIIDQMAIVTVNNLKQNPERYLAEVQALCEVPTRPEVFQRIAYRAPSDDLRWRFLLFYHILRLHVRDSDWGRIREIAEPWLQLQAAAADSSQFEQAAQALVTILANTVDAKIDTSVSYQNWCGTKVDTERIFITQISRLPVVFQRLGPLEKEDLVWLDSFAKQQLFRPAEDRTLLLVLWDGDLSVEQRRDLRHHMHDVYAINLVIADIPDLLRILSAAQPSVKFRTFVLKQIPATSPFVIVGPVPDIMFFGRERELDSIIQFIRHRISCALIGGRRIGKTSILLRLHRVHLSNAGFRSVYLDCSTIESFDDFAERKIHEWRPAYPDGPKTFGDLLHAVPGERKIVLLLDEADKLIPIDRTDNWRLFKHLRALANSGVAQVVLCGERALRNALRDPSSPLFNFTQEMIVGYLEPRAVEKLVSEPLHQLEFELVDQSEIVRRIATFTAGHPNIIQRLGRRLFELPTVSSSRRIKPDDVDLVIRAPSFQSDDFLSTLWESASQLEKIISLVMVAEPEARTLVTICQTLHRRCHISPPVEKVEEALLGLVDLRGILRQTVSGYEFAVEAFPRVVRSTVTLDDVLYVMAEGYKEAN